MAVVKVVELVGTSKESWEDAAKAAVEEAALSLRHITDVDVVKQSAKVDAGKITEYHTTLNVAFLVEHHTHIVGAGAPPKGK